MLPDASTGATRYFGDMKVARGRLVGLLVFMAVVVVCSWWYYDGHCDCHCSAQSEHVRNLGVLCRIMWEPAGVIGLVSVFMGLVGFILISGQMGQAEAANKVAQEAADAAKESAKQAKRSVDSYMANERGRITLVKAPMEHRELHNLRLGFFNSGKNSIFLEDSAFYVQVLDEKPLNRWIDHIPVSNRARSITVEPADEINTGDDLSKIQLYGRAVSILSDDEIELYRKDRLFVFIRGWIRYRDSFDRLWQLDVALNLHPAHGKFIREEHTELNRDRKLTAD